MLLWPYEWDVLVNYFGCDKPIKVKTESGAEHGYRTTPGN